MFYKSNSRYNEYVKYSIVPKRWFKTPLGATFMGAQNIFCFLNKQQ